MPALLLLVYVWGQAMKNINQSNTGFTLIELLIVVTIICMLAAISIPIFRDYTLRGYNSAATADLRYFRVHMESTFSEQQSYPYF